jgi:hypothetical protein
MPPACLPTHLHLPLQCTSAEVSRFRSLGACLPEGPANRTLKNCVDVDLAASLVYVNPRARMSVEGSPAVDSILCVAVDNSPILGRFLEDPGSLSSDVLSDPGVARKYSFKTSGNTGARDLPQGAAGPSSYNVGAKIPAAMAQGGAVPLRTAYGGWWALPLPGADGSCSFSGGGSPFAGFRRDVPASQCVVSQPLSSAVCSALSADRLVGSLRIGLSPRASTSSSSGWASVTVGSVSIANGTDGTVRDGTASDLTAAWDATSCTCTGAVVAVAYRVTYAVATSTIASVIADVTVADVSGGPAGASCGASPVPVPLTSSVSFVADTAAPGASYSSSSAVRYERSGAPGYRVGSPVLGGVLIARSGVNPSSTSPSGTDRLAVTRSAPPGILGAMADDSGTGFSLAGLTVRGPSMDGSCAAYTPTLGVVGGDRALPLAVRFGEDMSATCGLALDEAALAALCSASASVPAFFGLGLMNATAGSAPVPATHVGIFGNSDPWKAWQWARLDTGVLPTSASWDAARRTCTGIVSGIDIELLTASVGSAANPQHKIVAGRVSYATDSWAYSQEQGAPAAAGTGVQTFLLRTTVTFTEYKTADPTVFAPAPPVIPKIPSDLWYPFQTADDAAAQPFVTSGSTAAAAVAAGATAAVVAAAAVLLRGRDE